MKITISGLGGVGKGTVAKLLAKKLNFKYLSGGDFFRNLSKKIGISIYDFHKILEKNKKYDSKLDNMQKEFGKNNTNFVLESRLGWYFIPDSIKIKLICDENIRFERISKRENLELNLVVKKEKERFNSVVKRYKKLYNLDDFLNDKNFDIIIDTSDKTPEKIVDIILSKI